MEQIVHINLGQNLNYQVTYQKEVSENEYSNRRSGFYSRRDGKLYREEDGKIEDLMKNEQPVNSNFGSSSGSKVDPNIRSSKSYSSKLTIDKDILMDAFRRITPKYLHPAIDYSESKYVSVIVYREGDFFKKHTDTKMNNRHFATVLLFPPCEFTGGVLEIERTDGTVFEFKGSSVDWNLIMFEPTLKHSCSEILSGERILIKSQGRYDEYLYKYYRNLVSITEIPDNLEPKVKEVKKIEISDLVKKAKEGIKASIELLNESDFERDPDEYNEIYQELITNIQSEWEKVGEEIYNSKNVDSNRYSVDNILKRIKSEDALVKFVVLDSFYHDPIPANLYQFDLELLKAIISVYPTAYLKNLPVTIKDGEYSYDCDLHQEYVSGTDSFLGPGEKLNAVIALGGIHSGELVSKETEYNDDTYDPVYHRNYTCIVILK